VSKVFRYQDFDTKSSKLMCLRPRPITKLSKKVHSPDATHGHLSSLLLFIHYEQFFINMCVDARAYLLVLPSSRKKRNSSSEPRHDVCPDSELELHFLDGGIKYKDF